MSTLREMVIRGKNYREEYELEYFGGITTMELRPLRDDEYSIILGKLDGVVDEEELEEIAEDVDEMSEEDIDDSFDAEFINVMREVAKMGIDPESVGETQEGLEELVNEMIGGVSIDIGAEVMEITSNLQDAERFRSR